MSFGNEWPQGLRNRIPDSHRFPISLLLQATAFSYEPVTTIAKLEDGTEEWGGYEYRLFEATAKHLNFNFDIGPPVVCCVWGKVCQRWMTQVR